jgi:hypothetical protein
MKQLKEAVRQAIAQDNWYSALASALTLPDICGWLEYPNKGVGERYTLWYDTYIKEEYSGSYDNSNVEITFLSGKDCYALRCAYLHNGQDDITQQTARESLNQFQFVTPSKLGEQSKHGVRNTILDDACNIKYIQLQLEVDKFCEHICRGVDKWEVDVATREDIQQRINKLLIIVES